MLKRISTLGLIVAIIIVITIAVISVVGILLPKHWPSESAGELEQIRTNLPTAKSQWESYGITDYDIDVRVAIHLGMCYTDLAGKPTTLNIRQGRLVMTDELERQNLEKGCHVSELLPPKSFETIVEWLEQAMPNINYLSIEFDPTYGLSKRIF